MDAFAAHGTMSRQALDSERVRNGLSDILLGPARLYEALRAQSAAKGDIGVGGILELDRLIARSEQLEAELFGLFDPSEFPGDDKSSAVLAMCNLSLEHANALRALLRVALPTSAMAMLRLQYEALVRVIWVLYVAPDSMLAKLVAPLTPESAHAASNSLPTFSTMLKEIEKHGPPAVHRHLSEFKDYSWRPLNSFVHSGIHAVSRQRDGYAVGHLEQAVRQSNNLVHMSAMALAIHLESADLTRSVAARHRDYADCLQLDA